MRRGAGKHNPALLIFCVTKVTAAGSILPATAVNRIGNQVINRGERLRSSIDVIRFHPHASDRRASEKHLLCKRKWTFCGTSNENIAIQLEESSQSEFI